MVRNNGNHIWPTLFLKRFFKDEIKNNETETVV